jgi:hypothetical protein
MGVLLLLLFVFDLVDGSSPFTPESGSGSPAQGSSPGGAGGKDQAPDAEFQCARSLVVVPSLPSGVGPPRDRLVVSRPAAGLAGGFVPRPFHPPRHARS